MDMEISNMGGGWGGGGGGGGGGREERKYNTTHAHLYDRQSDFRRLSKVQVVDGDGLTRVHRARGATVLLQGRGEGKQVSTLSKKTTHSKIHLP